MVTEACLAEGKPLDAEEPMAAEEPLAAEDTLVAEASVPESSESFP